VREGVRIGGCGRGGGGRVGGVQGKFEGGRRGETNVLAGVAGAEGVDPLDDLHALVVAVFPCPGFGHGCCGEMTWFDRGRGRGRCGSKMLEV